MVVVIGYGNPLRGDDGIGPQVIEQLKLRFPASEVIELISCHQLNPELADDIARADHVIFIDATDKPAASDVVCESVIPQSAKRTYSHQLEPASLLAMAADLYGTCTPGTMITVAGESFDRRIGLSARAERGVAQTMATVEQLVAALTQPVR